MYDGLKSFQTAMSFKPESSLSFVYIVLLFFASRIKNHATYMVETNYLLVNEKLNFNIWNKKKVS
jgi:hypothetical protein